MCQVGVISKVSSGVPLDTLYYEGSEVVTGSSPETADGIMPSATQMQTLSGLHPSVILHLSLSVQVESTWSKERNSVEVPTLTV